MQLELPEIHWSNSIIVFQAVDQSESIFCRSDAAFNTEKERSDNIYSKENIIVKNEAKHSLNNILNILKMWCRNKIIPVYVILSIFWLCLLYLIFLIYVLRWTNKKFYLSLFE